MENLRSFFLSPITCDLVSFNREDQNHNTYIKILIALIYCHMQNKQHINIDIKSYL